MKKIIRRSFALLLAGALLMLGMPLAMAEETPSYTQVDYSTVLTMGEKVETPILDTDPFLSQLLDWSGYAKGYTVALESGKEYTFHARVWATNATYADRRLALLHPELSGDTEVDFVTSSEGYFGNGGPASFFYTFTPEVSGEYRLLLWGYLCDSNDDDLFGDDTLMELVVQETEQTPSTASITLSTREDLLNLNETLKNLHFGTPKLEITLENDFDLSDQPYTPAETSSSVHFYGNNHTITGLSDSLFSDVSDFYAQDLTLDLAFSRQNENSGQINGFGGLVSRATTAELYNCHVTGYASVQGYQRVQSLGGLIGKVYSNLQVHNCTSSLNITIKDAERISTIGGLIGDVDDYNNQKYIERSHYTGSISISNISSDAYDIGGLVGIAENYVFFTDCSAKVSISIQETEITSWEVGGLVGYLEDFNFINSCRAQVTIDAPTTNSVGGLVGYMDESNQIINSWAEGSVLNNQNAGGLVGTSDCCGKNVMINNCSAVDITATKNAGGFIGTAYNEDKFINCYASGTVTSSAQGAEPADAEEETSSLGNFVGYDYSFQTSDSSSTLTFQNCFFASNPDLSAIGYGLQEAEGLTPVDFSDDLVVQAMTDALNTAVSNGLEGENIYYPWGGKTSQNGPIPKKFDYTLVDYSTILTLDLPSDRVLEETAQISVNCAEWNGYPLGYTVALEAGKGYSFSATVSGEEAIYTDRAIAILPEKLTGDEATDFLLYQTVYADKDTCFVSTYFTPEVSGNYKVLTWGYCSGQSSDLFGEGTLLSVSVRELPAQPDLTLDIDSEEDLSNLAETLKAHPEALWPQINFLADLDMTDVPYTLPETDPFYEVTLKGNQHSVVGMTSPLLDSLHNLEVSQLTLKGSLSFEKPAESTDYMSAENVGLLANQVHNATLSDCLVEGTISFQKLDSVSDVGGLIGDIDGTVLLSSCTSLVDITVNSPVSVSDIAGFIGNANGDGFLAGCSWNGEIQILDVLDDVLDIGGILGDADSDWIFGSCSVEGLIQITPDETIYFDDLEDSVGGLAGDLGSNNAINSCSVKVTIDAPFLKKVGGLVGSMDSENTVTNSFVEGLILGNEEVGGLVGSSNGETGNGLLINCYSIANVEANQKGGGLVGVALGSDEFDNCYTAGTVSVREKEVPEEGEPAPATESSEEPVPVVMGAFVGEIGSTDGLEVSPFNNCFAARQENLPLVGNLSDDAITGLTAVDFSNDDAVQTMTDALNARVKEHNAQEEVLLTLLNWSGKNEANGPVFLAVIYGDANQNETIDAADALLALQHSVKLTTLEGNQFVAADVNGDDKVDASDALLMLQYTVKLINIFPVEK